VYISPGICRWISKIALSYFQDYLKRIVTMAAAATGELFAKQQTQHETWRLAPLAGKDDIWPTIPTPFAIPVKLIS
jgi:hypothetical protein